MQPFQSCRIKGSCGNSTGVVLWARTYQKISRWLRDVCSLRSLLPLHDLEFNRIALLQALVALAGNGAVVYEHIGPVVASNESVSFGVIEPLYSSFQSI